MYYKKLTAALLAAALCFQTAAPAMAAGPETAGEQAMAGEVCIVIEEQGKSLSDTGNGGKTAEEDAPEEVRSGEEAVNEDSEGAERPEGIAETGNAGLTEGTDASEKEPGGQQDGETEGRPEEEQEDSTEAISVPSAQDLAAPEQEWDSEGIEDSAESETAEEGGIKGSAETAGILALRIQGDSLDGFIYDVYSDPACTVRIGTLRAGEDGKMPSMELASGTYYVLARAVPEGYGRSPGPYTADIEGGGLTLLEITPERIPGTIDIGGPAPPLNDTASISLYGDADITFTGYEIKPLLIVKYGKDTLAEGEGYEVSFEDNVDAGTAIAHVRGIGSYSFEEDFAFEIKPHVLVPGDVQTSLGKYALRYNSHAYGRNSYLVAIGSRTLREGADYTVEGGDAFESGASGAEAVVTGIGNCRGSVAIRIPEYEPMEVDIGGSFVYGMKPAPDVSVRIGGTELVQGARAGDGDYYVRSTLTSGRIVKVEVIGEYDGAEIYEYKSIRLSPYSLTDKDISIEKKKYEYKGSAIKPPVTVRANGKTLVEGTDYAVQYKDNTGKGTAAITVTGMGNYAGTITIPFTIMAKAITPRVALSPSTFTYNGKARKPSVTVKDGSTVLKASDYDVKWPSSVKAGTYKVSVTLKGNYSGTGAAWYRISPKKADPSVILSKAKYTYDGKAKKPSVTVKDGSTVLKASDYAVAYAKGRVNVGTYTVKVTLKGNYSGEKTASFTIVPRAAPVTYFEPIKNKLAFRVKWKKQAGQVTGYQVQYSTDGNFKKNVRSVTVKGAGSASAVLKDGIRSGEYYYVRVRAYKTAGKKAYYSAWSYY